MIDQLHHRGPDASGSWTDGAIGLAHTRLSIVDIAGGAQPISNEDGTVHVIFNGEIFNFIELRAELESRGHRFRTKTDTEVLVHLYEDDGLDLVHRLNGQFAFGIWDSERRRLVLARDRPGIIPLFHAQKHGRLLFASEVKALLPLLGKPSLDPAALDQILTLWAPVSPRTAFSGVSELSPGHMLVAEDGRIDIRRWWDWTFPDSPDQYLRGDPQGLADELWSLLEDAARMRLRGDVPVGSYLSGGLDSSTLATLVRSAVGERLRTFSIEFEEKELDEARFQRLMADRLATDHSHVRCTSTDVGDAFPATIRATECPILRTAPTPMGLLSGLVRSEGYKVVLTGEGADEVLGGYDVFKEAKVRWFWARQPRSKWRPLLLQRLYPYLNLSSVRARRYVREFFGTGLDEPNSPLFAHLPRWAVSARAKNFLSADFADGVPDAVRETVAQLVPDSASRWHPFNRAQYVEAKLLMGGYLLSSQGDRMLMKNSVEGRFPFLDHRVMEFASRLDPRLKMRVLNEKYLLKVAAGEYLPKEILDRPKQPYRAPDSEAFFGSDHAVPEYVNDLLSEETLRRTEYFDPRRAELLVAKARRGDVRSIRDNQALVGILSTQLWHHHFVDRYHAEYSPDL